MSRALQGRKRDSRSAGSQMSRVRQGSETASRQARLEPFGPRSRSPPGSGANAAAGSAVSPFCTLAAHFRPSLGRAARVWLPQLNNDGFGSPMKAEPWAARGRVWGGRIVLSLTSGCRRGARSEVHIHKPSGSPTSSSIKAPCFKALPTQQQVPSAMRTSACANLRRNDGWGSWLCPSDRQAVAYTIVPETASDGVLL